MLDIPGNQETFYHLQLAGNTFFGLQTAFNNSNFISNKQKTS